MGNFQMVILCTVSTLTLSYPHNATQQKSLTKICRHSSNELYGCLRLGVILRIIIITQIQSFLKK